MGVGFPELVRKATTKRYRNWGEKGRGKVARRGLEEASLK